MPFIFNLTFVDFLSKANKLKEFVDLFLKAFVLLRKKSKDIIRLIEILLSSGLPEISIKSMQYLEDSLSLNKSQKEAEDIMDHILGAIMDKN